MSTEEEKDTSIILSIPRDLVSGDPIIESFVSYYRTRVANNPESFTSVARGLTTAHDGEVESTTVGGGGSRRRRGDSSDACLKSLIKLLADEVDHSYSGSTQSDLALAEAISHLRSESDITDVYKGRIVDLQRVINGTKLPGDLDALIGKQEVVVPIGADSSPHQKQREAVHDVARLAGRTRDTNERLRAQNAMLSTQVGALLAENSLLMDRISLLEEQVSALGASAALTMRELNKVRHNGGRRSGNTSTTRSASSGSSGRPQRSGEEQIAGVSMDRETALWLKDVYKRLTSGEAVEDIIASSLKGGAGGGKLPPRPGSTASTRRGSSSPRGSTPFSRYVEAARSDARAGGAPSTPDGSDVCEQDGETTS